MWRRLLNPKSFRTPGSAVSDMRAHVQAQAQAQANIRVDTARDPTGKRIPPIDSAHRMRWIDWLIG
jgi:hypothetical protein